MNIYKICEVAEKLRVSQVTVRRLIKKGAIGYRRVGRIIIVCESDLIQYLNKNFFPMKEG